MRSERALFPIYIVPVKSEPKAARLPQYIGSTKGSTCGTRRSCGHFRQSLCHCYGRHHEDSGRLSGGLEGYSCFPTKSVKHSSQYEKQHRIYDDSEQRKRLILKHRGSVQRTITFARMYYMVIGCFS
ncbi:hypothetical protein V5799_016707 [Amblyomma americanum]|uniref:Uncharacterized protein n=1 Tax=Amblyomma americanum TaxID=6943 RepID=A0AAQ4F533_AMBAM